MKPRALGIRGREVRWKSELSGQGMNQQVRHYIYYFPSKEQEKDRS